MAKLADLFILLGLKKDGFDRGLDDAKQKTAQFGEGMKKVGGIIAGVFAVGAIVNFGRELLKINSEADGVRNAFSRVGDASTLAKLRESVKGTVTDLDLMKRAVSANNFGIPIKQLGNLLAFAAKRAQDTGQSVDYLVDSIVTGIGRKSPLILDNLGISAVQLKSKLGSVGMEAATVGDIAVAVGKIADESLTKTGGMIDNNGSKVQRLNARWQNYKEFMASSMAPVFSVILSLFESLTTSINDNVGDLKKEQSAMNSAALATMGLKEGTDKRRMAIENLKKLYPQYFKDLDSEKSKNEDVSKALESANKQYANKIVLAQYEQELGKVAKAEERLETNRVNAVRSLQQFNERYNIHAKTLDELKQKTRDFIKYQNSGNAQTSVAGGYLVGLENALDVLDGYEGKLEDINKQKTNIDSARQSIEKLLGIDCSIASDGETPASEAVKTAKEQLEELKKVADEVDAQRILKKEFYGESMTGITPIGTPRTIDQAPGDSMGQNTAFLDNMDSHNKLIKEKTDKFTKEQLEDWTNFTEELNQTIESGMGDAIGSFAAGIGELMATGDWSNFGSGLLKTIGGFMQQMGALFIAYAIASKQFAAALGLGPANPMAWGLAMAAGVGLVAAGSAISSLASSGMKGSGGGASVASGYGSYSSGTSNAIKVDVGGTFELHGTTLRAAIHNTERRNALIR